MLQTFLSFFPFFLIYCSICNAAEPVLNLQVAKTTVLSKKDSAELMGAIVIPQNGLLVWDLNLTKRPPDAQIQLYGNDGNLIRQIGESGRGPGKYSILQGVSIDHKNVVWVADAGQRRISRFGLDGALLGSDIIMNPTLSADSILLRPEQDKKYIGGCLAKDGMPMKGCLGLVHEYELNSGKFLRSFISTTEDEQRIERQYVRLQQVLIDSETPAAIYVSDRASNGFWILDIPSGTSHFIKIPGLPILPDMNEVTEARKAWDTLQTISHIFQIKGDIYIGLRTPTTKSISTQVLKFTSKGHFLARTGSSPGMLVGKTRTGNLLFARKTSTGVTILAMTTIVGKARN